MKMMPSKAIAAVASSALREVSRHPTVRIKMIDIPQRTRSSFRSCTAPQGRSCQAPPVPMLIIFELKKSAKFCSFTSGVMLPM